MSTTHPADGALSRAVRRVAGASPRRPGRVIGLWMLFVVACAVAGAMAGTKTLTNSQTGTGESARADRQIAAAGLRRPATESILVRSADPATTRAAEEALEARLARLPEVRDVKGPREAGALSTAGGRAVLVQAMLRGDPDDAKLHVVPLQRAVAAVASEHPAATLHEAGAGTVDKAFEDLIAEDLKRSEVISLPVTLAILVLAFGALVAACVPLLVGITCVVAAMGLFGVLSHVAPDGGSTGTLVVLIGLAVSVDYSLFYIRREREERRAGASPHAAVEAAAATVGRAVVLSGLIVMVAIAGLLFTGLAVFTSMALATMGVIAIAVVASVTVLPATLALLGDRIDRGRIPFLRRRRGAGPWGPLARGAASRPVAALVTVVALLGALAVPALDLRTASTDLTSIPSDTPVVVAQHAIERWFPGAPQTAEVVVSAHGLRAAGAHRRLQALGAHALAVTGGRGAVTVDVARDGRTAVVSVPMPDRGREAADETVAALRRQVTPTADRVAPGAEALLTGDAAGNADFTGRLNTSTPLVIAFVLSLAFVLLVAAFRSPALAGAVIGLNVLSIGAAYGALAAIFQHDWAEGPLNFINTGAVANWLPLFAFVILFGLSMDYTILVLERIREARRAGRSAREAAAEGVAATAGTVTSAAVVMVAVFAMFGTMRFVDTKELGVGLSVAILIDATVVRAIALPAAVALLGERRWRVPRRGSAPVPARGVA